MIYQGTFLRVMDNTGALTALCIKVLTKTPTASARHGDKIIVVIKTIIPEKRVKRGQIHKALVIWLPTNKRRLDGSYIKFAVPACILIKRDGTPLGNRIRGPICKELRELGHTRIVSIASLCL